MEYDFEMLMYDTLKELIEKNEKDASSFSTLSQEEKVAKAEEMKKDIETFRGLKVKYNEYMEKPSKELMEEIKTKYADILGLTEPEETKTEETKAEDEEFDIDLVTPLFKPVLKPVDETKLDSQKVNDTKDGVLLNFYDWCNNMGFDVTDASGFTPSQLDPEYLMNLHEFSSGLFKCKYEYVKSENKASEQSLTL